MYTFEQLFEAANPNRNPRLKLDIGDTVVVSKNIAAYSYESAKNKKMAGKQGKVVARYPYSQSLKIGVDFGDGQEYKITSSFLKRIIQPDEQAPVSRDAKKQEIINQAAAKNPRVIQIYDAQKHQQILNNTLMFLKAVQEHATNNQYKGKIDFENKSSIIPLYVVNFPPNMVFPLSLTSLNKQTIADALTKLGLTIATHALTIKDAIMVQTSAQGCSFVVCKAEGSGFSRNILPFNITRFDTPHSIVDSLNYVKGMSVVQRDPLKNLLFKVMRDYTSPAEKYLTVTVVHALLSEYGDSVSDFKTFLNNYAKFSKSTVEKQPLITGQLNGIKAFGSELFANFVDGRLQSTEQDPSIMMKTSDASGSQEVQLWIDNDQFSSRLPNAVFKVEDREFFGYVQQRPSDKLLFTHQTKHQLVNVTFTLMPNSCPLYDFSHATTISDSATINYVCFQNLNLDALKDLTRYSMFENALFLSDESIAKMTQSNISNDALESLTTIISEYLQLKNDFNWPDCDIVCLCDVTSTMRWPMNVKYLVFPNNFLSLIQQHKQFKAQMSQEIGDELADVADMF